MSLRRGGLAAALAAATAAIAAGASTPAAASSEWEARLSGSGGEAVSCEQIRERLVCAKVYCQRDGRMHIGVDGLREPRNVRPREGRVSINRDNQIALWSLQEGPSRDGVVWRADFGDLDYLLRRMKSGSLLSLYIGGGKRAVNFTLDGSRAAINLAERHCDKLARSGRDDNRRAGPPPIDDRRGPPVLETSPWRYAEFRRGGAALSCGLFGQRGREICAVFYCRRGELSFGLDGLREDRGGVRSGRIEIGGFSRRFDFSLVEGPRRDERIWRADVGRIERLAQRAMNGAGMAIDIEPRRRPLEFTLANSSRAIGRVMGRCKEISDRRSSRRYERDIVGRWGEGGFCRDNRWRFGERGFVTPRGVVCERVSVRDASKRAPDDAVIIRGERCRRGILRVSSREFEAYRDRETLVLRTLFGRDRVFELERCER